MESAQWADWVEIIKVGKLFFVNFVWLCKKLLKKILYCRLYCIAIDAIVEERAVRVEYKKAKHELYKTVNNKSKLAKRFRQIQHKYIEGVYKNNKESNKNKIENLKTNQNVKVVTQNAMNVGM